MSVPFGSISHSTVAAHSHNGRRNPEARADHHKLNLAIDTLRREWEVVLWEYNSLKTQNSVLEQRILDQTGELDTISRNLKSLREQHAVMEGQYTDKLNSLRFELHTLQKERSSSRSVNPLGLESQQPSSSIPEVTHSTPAEERARHRRRPPPPVTIAPFPAATSRLSNNPRRSGRDTIDECDYNLSTHTDSEINQHSRQIASPSVRTTQSCISRSRIYGGETKMSPSNSKSSETTFPSHHRPSLSPTTTLVGSPKEKI